MFDNDPRNDSPLTRQTSIYSLTFEEFQNSIASGLGKDLGSMNMDELLKNIWNAEEQNVSASGSCPPQFDDSLQRQGSLTLPRTLSQKTVDEVWNDISRGLLGGRPATMDISVEPKPPRQQTLGEITLEEFLVRAGVVKDESAPAKQENYCAMAPQPEIFPNLAVVPSDTPPQQSPTPFNFNIRGRRSGNKIERVAERRQRRMIKNRESAARSRARKQAYTMELEAEVAKLKEENNGLRRKEAELVKEQDRQELEMKSIKQGAKRGLRRTHTGPW